MKRQIISILSLLALLMAVSSCSDSKSYADLLNEENQVVNAFLAQHRVVETWPGVDNCEVGEDAPFYCVDDEGNVYMQVIRKGDGTFPEEGEHVSFTYLSYDLNYYVVGSDSNVGSGNLNSPGSSAATYFIFDDYTLEQSSQYGTGIQIPVKLLGFGSKVNVVIKSQAGPSAYMSYVIPFLYDIAYYKQVSNPL
ncbi:DUF4827 family protein [uncultured Duncaniella sp.]|uniref:DUF4827 family protein n=1 Tax=uncultured Duncaniella sp. TaxID=2768039 RepID=UPI002676FCC7|nr:DUF4827 family protein [uncultured Duncaniella sp.]MCI9171672.1 DUF4827 domain-containing protein [Muribaculaceae bacterium]